MKWRRMQMTPLSERDRLKGALAVARALHNTPGLVEKYPTGTVLTPIGTEGDHILYAVSRPEEATSDQMDRAPRVA
jgi:hypothetical protein